MKCNFLQNSFCPFYIINEPRQKIYFNLFHLTINVKIEIIHLYGTNINSGPPKNSRSWFGSSELLSRLEITPKAWIEQGILGKYN